jgi:hypothetical protein
MMGQRRMGGNRNLGPRFPHGMPAMEEDTIKVRYGLVASAGSKCAIQ